MNRSTVYVRAAETTALIMLVVSVTGLAIEVAFVAPSNQIGLPFILTMAVVIGVCLMAIRMLREQADQAASLAGRDELSGLHNRRFFSGRLEDVLGGRESAAGTPALFMLDLDRFKVINDTLGHLAGDQLLKEVSRRLVEHMHGQGVVARLGGDEFAVLVTLPGEPEARALASGILRALDKPVSIDGQTIWPNASIGVALAGQPWPSPQELMRMADVALYQAKERGRGRYSMFEAKSILPSVRRLSLETELRTAIAERQLEMFYQPIVDLDTMSVANVEALVRWNHPTMGLLTPDKFMALADETGLSRNVAAWVMTEVCHQAKSWEDLFGDAVGVSINLSALQFRDIDFIPELRDILERTGANHQTVNFEVTESLLMEEHGETITNLRELRSLGFKVAIDDFGVGYSSLSYLRRFDVDILKIDQSFVQDEDVEKSLAIVSAVVQLSHTLGMRTVAEGVETEEQLAWVRQAGCDAAQGYLLASPVSAGTVTEMIARKGLIATEMSRDRSQRNAPLWRWDLSRRWVYG